jgi:cytochrome c-type biogenesis protein CcmE
MKPKYLIGILVAIIFVVVVIFSFDQSKIDYADFAKAEETSNVVQIIGKWDKNQPSNYDSDKDEFHFHMIDENNNKFKVVYNGARPNNFDMAESIVCKGKALRTEYSKQRKYLLNALQNMKARGSTPTQIKVNNI